jgi:hypothetical protein
MQRAVKAAKAGNHNGHPLRSGVPMEAIEGADRYPQQSARSPRPIGLAQTGSLAPTSCRVVGLLDRRSVLA